LFPIIVQGPGPEKHKLWAEIKADPAVPDPRPLKDLLAECLLSRAREIATAHPGHEGQLIFQYLASEQPSIAYAELLGCALSESIFRMARDLRLEVSVPPLARSLSAREWRMESQAERTAYVAAYNECFPEAPLALADWQYFLTSPQWTTGSTITAFDGTEIAGSVLAYWDEAGNRASGRRVGLTEYIFVRPPWRRQGVASHLICRALSYLKERGLAEAGLEVRAGNRSALCLYEGLGYYVVQESGLYVRDL
jgi:ribosomal protein S18 acetylase RimI-like enzyme